MATEKFLKLSDFKKEMILSALKEEILSRPYNDIRVSSVITKAGISRASFYMYFEDKDDMLRSLLDMVSQETGQLLCQAFQKNEGRFYNAMRSILIQAREEDKWKKYEKLLWRLREDEGCIQVMRKIPTCFLQWRDWEECSHKCFQCLDHEQYPNVTESLFTCALDMGFTSIAQVIFSEMAGVEKTELTGRILKQLRIIEMGMCSTAVMRMERIG